MIGKGRDCLFPIYYRIPEGKRQFLRVRCGHCINCRLAKRQEWTNRLTLESKYWTGQMCFVTLTYADEFLPTHVLSKYVIQENEIEEDITFSTLRVRDVQLFLKRLRKSSSSKVRYFLVGEYGTGATQRPHYHVMFFGLPYSLETVYLVKKSWGKGHVDVKPFDTGRCAYIAGYVQKKIWKNLFDHSDENYKILSQVRIPEFLRCSQHLGEQYILDHLNEYDDEHCYLKIGKWKHSMPRQFRKVLIREGRVKEQGLSEMWFRQMCERDELMRSLRLKGVNPSDFFRNRIELAKVNDSRLLSRRKLSGDLIHEENENLCDC